MMNNLIINMYFLGGVLILTPSTFYERSFKRGGLTASLQVGQLSL